MFEAPSLATAPAVASTRVQAPEGDIEAIVPPQPGTLRDTGLDSPLVLALLAKTIARAGKTHLHILGGKLRLSMSVLREALALMMAEKLIEVARCGDSDIDIEYQLTGPGRAFADAAFAECRYVGPAPVTLDALREVIARDARRHAVAGHVGDAALAAALCDGPGDDILDAAVRAQLGAAWHSGRALLLHGASGCGKSTLAGKLGRLLQGVVALPYAVLVDHRIIQFYDPLLHQSPPAPLARQFDERRNDGRWLICQRPLVRIGAELTSEMLDCRLDLANGVHHAPPQLQASGGLLIVDDLGRQRGDAGALLDRLTAPLETGVDVLVLQGGHTETVQYAVTTVFVTSCEPQTLFDAALLRRVAYKVALGPLTTARYLALLRRHCTLLQVPYDDAAAAHLLARLHAPSGQPLLAYMPRELVARIVDAAAFAGVPPRLCRAAIEQAWHSLFACTAPPQTAHAASHVQSGETA